MVELNVSQQLKGPIGTVREYEVNDIVDFDGAEQRVKGRVTLTHTNRGILVIGQVKTTSELNCSRCLDEFSQELTMDIEEEYLPSVDINTGAPLPPPEEPGTFTIDENNILDLTEAIRQYTLLATPMKPLCREDCAGLCPTCGANLNQTSCDCPPRPVDPRWSGLEKLLLNNNEATVKQEKGK